MTTVKPIISDPNWFSCVFYRFLQKIGRANFKKICILKTIQQLNFGFFPITNIPVVLKRWRQISFVCVLRDYTWKDLQGRFQQNSNNFSYGNSPPNFEMNNYLDNLKYSFKIWPKYTHIPNLNTVGSKVWVQNHTWQRILLKLFLQIRN